MKFIIIRAKYTWQDYKTNEDILSALKINPVVKKTKTYRNKGHNIFGEWTETDRQTATLKYEISTMWETKPKKKPQKVSRPLIGPEQVKRPKTLQAIYLFTFYLFLTAIGLTPGGSSTVHSYIQTVHRIQGKHT
jgi:hypothetical protein